MIAVKIECECGQHYAFDVEPISGRMPSTVACPTCGTDGTPTANEIIALQSPPAEPIHIVPPPAPPSPSRSNVQLKAMSAGHEPARVSSADARKMGMVDREQAEIEARAKMSWGDSPDAVTKYLMLQGFSVPEAQAMVTGLYKERLAAVRVAGIKKIVSGIALMLVPVFAFLYCLSIRFYPVRLLAIAVAIGLWGVWRVVNGLIAVLMPKMESGDVAEQ